MNGGPYRAPQPSERRVINREAPASRSSEEQTQAVKSEPQPARRAAASKKSEARASSKRPHWLVVVLLVVIAAALGWLAWSKIQAPVTAIDSSKYQVVFLTNGQFYFGKLEPMNDQYMKLTKVYYMQTEQSEQATANNTDDATAENNYKLIKLGNEIHGPEDAMMISNAQVLYYENLKPDGKVAQLIKQDSGK